MANSVRGVITSEYQQLQVELHKNPNYGVASLGYAPVVADLLESNEFKSVSDYGAGKCNLKKGLYGLKCRDFEYYPYDPAFPEYGVFRSADLICCIDVLEHVEPDCLSTVLEDLSSQMQLYGFFTIHTGPAQKVLADGRNAHLIQEPCAWWLDKLGAFFEVHHFQKGEDGKGFWVVVSKLGSKRNSVTPLLSQSHYSIAARASSCRKGFGKIIKRLLG